MSPRRNERGSDYRSDSSEQLFPTMASETMRTPKSHAMPNEMHGRGGEEKISLFWRIFGGTILSISALVLITVYQSVSGSIHDLRTDLAQLKEAKADFVKKDDYSASRTRTWDRMQEMQKEFSVIAAPVGQLKDRIGQLEDQSKSFAVERKDISELQATIKERLTQFELQLTQGKMTQKDVQTVQQLLTGLQEKTVLRDQQLKQLEDERKELLKEIQALRERVARLEAAKEAAPGPKNDAESKPAKSKDKSSDT